jgi:hypothetical protein
VENHRNGNPLGRKKEGERRQPLRQPPGGEQP